VDQWGTRSCVVEHDTLFRLEARRGGSLQRGEQEIEVVSREGRDVAIGAPTECAGDFVVAVPNLPPDAWDAAVRVGEVSADTTRRISIVHAGRTAVLGPHAPSTDVFRGAPIAGKWVLGSPVASAETCESSARAPTAQRPPDALGVTVHATCGN
jgi:hypothetical protein